MGEVGQLIRGNGLQKKDFTETGVPAIHYGQIYTFYGNFATETKSFVSPELAKQLKKVDTGDVVIINTSENLEDVGKAMVYLGEKQAVTGGHATIFKPGKNILGKYFVYFTQTTEFTKEKRKAELFAAAFMGKSIVVFRRSDATVDSGLQDFFVALQSAYSAVPTYIGTDASLLEHWKQFCSSVGGRRAQGAENAGFLVDTLSIGRAVGTPRTELENPGVEFVGGWKGANIGSPDSTQIRNILSDVRRQSEMAVSPLTAAAQLSRLWLVFRDLAGTAHADGAVAVDAEQLVLLDATLGLWTEAASWFGRLHGHTELGPLAAANSRFILQQSLRATNASPDPSLYVRPIVEARASALYSIAVGASSASRQRFHHQQVVRLVTGAIKSGDRDADAARATRAHSFLRLARLGRPWFAFRAERDMRLAIAHAEVTGAPPGRIGLLLLDYGFIQWLLGKRRTGRANMKIGEKTMSDNLAFVGEAALERAHKKIAWTER